MASYYEVPGGITWCKKNLHVIIGNKPLEEIMQFGDLWRERGHKPLVHVISPAMDGGKMWDKHEDPSGLLDNIPSHIDMLIVDFYNRETPELPSRWAGQAEYPYWRLWEYAAGKVKFNGPTLAKFIEFFGVDPTTTQDTTPPAGGDTTPPTTLGSDVTIHMVCPHCGKKIY